LIKPLDAGRLCDQFADEFPSYAASQAAWRQGYAKIAEAVQMASAETFVSSAFQERLWDKNPISNLGPGVSVTVHGAYTDADLAAYLLHLRDTKLSGTAAERGTQVNDAFEGILKRVRPHNARRPKARTVRLLAAIYVSDMCSILDERRIWEVSQLLGLPPYKHGHVAQHPVLRNTLRSILASRHLEATDVEQSMLLWYLWERFCKPTDEVGPPGRSKRSAPPLALLPAEAQRRSLPFITNNISVLVAMMREAEPGLVRADLTSVIQREAPQLKSLNSIGLTISQAQGGLGLLQLADGAYRPTEAGLTLLAAPDPTIVLQPLLINRVFGIGHLLLALRDNDGAMPKKELQSYLSALFPNVTSQWRGGELLNWATNLKLATLEDNQVRLTEDGEAYADALPEDFKARWQLSTPVSIVDGPQHQADYKVPFRPAAWTELRTAFEATSVEGSLVYPSHVLPHLHAALHASGRKRFVLLAGLSGTGKTELARAYSRAYCTALGLDLADRCAVVAVRPDWTDPAGLLGYTFADESGTTNHQPGEALELLLSANRDPSTPWFLCLDEMNLARVEHYFAPLLSAMEGSEGRIRLHNETDAIGDVPAEIAWPSNLFIFGTVNMDESTHPFSDKVLDRAFTFEFWDVDLEAWRQTREKTSDPATLAHVYSVLAPLNAALAKARRQFAYRVANEVLAFCSQDVSSEPDALLDGAILAKVLPRVRGDDAGPLTAVLSELLGHLPQDRFPRARAKVHAMHQSMALTGQARFWS